MAILFEDVTESAGISLVKQSWGVAWGDLNGDGFPDLWINNHQQKPVTLYLNQQNGTFEEITDQAFVSLDETSGDFHGAAWFDFDNDGDQDLFQLSGGAQGLDDDSPAKQKRLFVNNNGQLQDRATSLGINYPLGRGRVAVPVDINKDGLLDVVFTSPLRNDGQGESTVFLQTADGDFDNIGASTGLNPDVPNGTFALISNLIGDNHPELIYFDNSKPLTIYDISTLPFQDISTEIIGNFPSELNKVQDIAVADFNNDLKLDLYVTQEGSPNTGFRRDTVRQARATLRPSETKERGLEFDAEGGNVRFDFDGDIAGLRQLFLGTNVSTEDIFIGSTGFNPDSLEFTLNPNNFRVSGIAPFTPTVDRGVYIGYSRAKKTWQILWSSNDTKDEVNFVVQSDTEISDIAPINFKESFTPSPDFLLINSDRGLIEQTEASGIDPFLVSGHNVVAGDLDNDMDVDIYVVGTGNVKNLPNVLYENQGDGTFVAVADAGGAAGTELGLGDAVVIADYDLDGFLDLYVTNGDVLAFKRPFLIDGPNQLFRNQGNDNHWLQVDLQGVISNRDGIGAQIIATAGDKQQLREQNSGVHNKGQNYQRIHFGLADNNQVNLLEINWTSGIIQKLSNIDADQIINVVEGIGTANNDTICGSSSSETLIGNSGNDLLQGKGGNDILEGNDGLDTLEGHEGDDFLLGGKGKDTLDGGIGKDTLNGGSWNDILNGGADEDVLISGRGKDTVTGGAGADTFFYSIPEHGRDIITDFAVTEDTIDLSQIITGASFSSPNPFDDYVSLVQSGNNTKVLIDQNGDAVGGEGRLIANLENVHSLTVVEDNFVFG